MFSFLGLSFVLLNRNVDQPYKYVATWLIDEWSKVGLKVTQRVLPTGPFFEALRNNVIAGAALDVFEDEPLMAPGLAECHNALLVPHIASGSQDTRDRMATMAATNAIAHLNGTRAPNVVNPEVYDSPAYRARRSAASA